MADVILTARFLRKAAIALNLRPFAFTAYAPVVMGFAIFAVVNIPAAEQLVNLTVSRNYTIKLSAFFHSLTHKFLCLHAAAIVRKADYIFFH